MSQYILMQFHNLIDELSREILSDITVFNKYAKHIPEKARRESWREIVERNKSMHKKKFPNLSDLIDEAYEYVLDKKVLPSMRSMQFAGLAAEINPARLYNCSFMIANDYRCFQEAMYLLLSGCGKQICTYRKFYLSCK